MSSKNNIREESIKAMIEEYEKAQSKKEKGQIIHNWSGMLGVSKSQLYRKKNEYLGGSQLNQRTDHGVARVNTPEIFRRDLMRIAGFLKTTGGTTEESIKILCNKGLLDKQYALTTITRHLRDNKLNLKSYRAKKANSVRLVSPYPNYCWMVDATVGNIYYIKNKNRLEFHDSITNDTSHKEDRIRKEGLEKVWVYFMVDHFSGMYDLIAFSGAHLGENAHHWYRALSYFLMKYGLPKYIYSDKGSGLKSDMIQAMFQFFHIDFKTHLPGNPGAKGQIERMIGVHKRKFESLLRGISERIESIDSYNMFMQAQAKDYNRLKGRDLLFRSNLKGLFMPEAQQLRDSITLPDERTITKSGEFQYKNKLYHVSHELNKGDKVTIYQDYKGYIFVKTKDGQTYQAKPEGVHKVIIHEKFKSYPKTKVTLQQEEATEEGKKIKKVLTLNDLMPKVTDINQTKIIQPPLKGKRPATQAITPQDKYQTNEEVWMFIVENTGFKRGRLTPDLVTRIEGVIQSSIRAYGYIQATEVLLIINTIRKEMNFAKEETNAN